MSKITTGRFTLDGKVTNVTIEPDKCPHLIMVGEHYRDDGSCRCDDPKAREMSDWGYSWDDEKSSWV